MSNGLEFKSTDWTKEVERELDHIVEEIASELSRNHPELFTQGALSGQAQVAAESLVKRAVASRKDLYKDEHETVAKAIMGQVTGYGPLSEFFNGTGSEEITEVMVNPFNDGRPKVFFGKHGRQHYAGNNYFKNDRQLEQYCQKICEDASKPFGEDSPIVDAWMQDGSRVAVMGFKASPLGTALTIRKSPLLRPPLPLCALVESGTFPQAVADMLVDLLVHGHPNLGVFGRTDSGKTTVLRSLGENIDPNERVIIGETSFEMSFPNLPNLINMVEVIYGEKKVVTMNDICKSINRNNPDRAMVGEIRGGEIVAASEIAESTSGGFWTTGHAGGVTELRSRLPKMFQQGGMSLPRDLVDEQLKAMFHFLIFLDKSFDNKRTLMSLVEVTEDGYRSIVRFDEHEFAKSGGSTRRWIYENSITPDRLSRLAFRGAKNPGNYEKITEKHLYIENAV